MNIVPFVMIVVGGIMIYAGVKGSNPLVELRKVLQNG